jgi:formylglycine-generating enzyme required for sulfatase activity
MQIKIDISVPQWTKWLAAGLAVGIVLGVGVGRVSAGTVAVKTNWASGDTLTAADLNANFVALKTAVDQLKKPDCPEDYARDTTATAFTLCKKGVDEVVKVGTGGSAFWIDRYEASIWANTTATGTQYGLANFTEYPATFPENGEYTAPLYALSVPLPSGSLPSSWMTWFQAQAACRLSGKRLPTDEEWLAAAQGTPDPGAHPGTGGFCVTSTSGPRNPGAGTACVSAWGAQDMIGNLWEMTSNWYAGLAADNGATQSTWTRSAYNGDGIWNVASQAGDDGWIAGLPAMGLHGSDWIDGVRAGRFALFLERAPSSRSADVGFRCVVPH